MDFFQGSLPPNFISFCLENQSVDESQIQTNTATSIPAESAQTSVPNSVPNLVRNPVPSPPPFPPLIASSRSVNLLARQANHPAGFHEQTSRGQSLKDPHQAHPTAVDSPFSADSNVDVTTYADEMVERLEGSRSPHLEISEEGGQTEQESSVGSFQGIEFLAELPPARTSTSCELWRICCRPESTGVGP